MPIQIAPWAGQLPKIPLGHDWELWGELSDSWFLYNVRTGKGFHVHTKAERRCMISEGFSDLVDRWGRN